MRKYLIIILILTLKALAFPVNFSGSLSLESYYQSVSNISLLNRDDILELPAWNYLVSFKTKVSDQLFTAQNHYYLKVRGYINFSSTYDSFSNNYTNQEGSLLFGADEFYLDYEAFPWLYFLAGKERTIWGNGLLFNPMDIINPKKDRFNPIHDEEGAMMFKTVLQGENLSASIYVLPDFIDSTNRFEYMNTAAAGKLSADIFDIEFNLYYYESFDKGQEINALPKYGLTLNYLVPGWDMNLYTDWLNDRENTYTYYKDSGNNYESYNKNNLDAISGIIGLSYNKNFGIQFSIAAEYFYNGEGCNPNEKKNYFNYLKSNYDELDRIKNKSGIYENLPSSSLAGIQEQRIGIIKSTIGMNDDFYLNRHYLGINLVLSDIFSFLDLKSYVMTSLPDMDIFTYQEAQLNFWDNFNIVLYSLIAGGNSYSQYGNNYFNYSIGNKISFIF